MRPSDKLREANSQHWNAVINHPFCLELAGNTLPLDTLRRYLLQDYCFIDNFVRLAASAIHHAPTLPDRLPLAHFLGIIAGPENTYFQRSFDELGVPESQWAAPELLSPTIAFQNLMQEAAESGHYGTMVAVLCVAEWTYLSWAAPHAEKSAKLPFYFGEWIDLHCGEYFESVVEHLRQQLDNSYEKSTENEKQQIEAAFTKAVKLEHAFFDATYNPNPLD